MNRLGLWISGPLLGLLPIWWAIEGLPNWDCGEGKPTSPEETVLVVVTGIASVAVTAAAIARLRVLWRRHGPRKAVLSVLAVVGAPLLVYLVVGLSAGVLTAFVVAIVSGVLFTAILLLALLIARASGRGVDDVGVLLPLYLLGTALGLYPSLAFLALVAHSGLGC